MDQLVSGSATQLAGEPPIDVLSVDAEPFIELAGVTVDYPVFGANSRSMKRKVLSFGAGGRIGVSGNDQVIVRALDNINFRLEVGDKLALLGHNGAGKTTLLRVIAGVYEPTQGKLQIRGRTGGLYDLTLGMDPDASGYDNIVLRGMLLGMSRDRIEALIPEIEEFTELGDYLRLPLRTYSSGMLLRLGYAVTTAIDLDVILMDEWISVGDQYFHKKADKRLEEMLSKTRIMVLATHAPELVKKTCNKALWLKNGEVVMFGEAFEVADAYISSNAG